MKCKAKRIYDQYRCTLCSLAWDADDNDPPQCNPKEKRDEKIINPGSASKLRNERRGAGKQAVFYLNTSAQVDDAVLTSLKSKGL